MFVLWILSLFSKYVKLTRLYFKLVISEPIPQHSTTTVINSSISPGNGLFPFDIVWVVDKVYTSPASSTYSDVYCCLAQFQFFGLQIHCWITIQCNLSLFDLLSIQIIYDEIRQESLQIQISLQPFINCCVPK